MQEISLDIVHFVAGFTDEQPEGLMSFLDLRSDLTELKQCIEPKFLDCVKSKAKKADWIKAFVRLAALDRRAIVIRNPLMIALLPRDIKRLGLKVCKSCGVKAFNPGKRVEFSVYGVFDVMTALTPKTEEKAA
jgi:hypothetical protein